jgi:Fic family protein
VTQWQDWFLPCLNRAIAGSRATLAKVLAKARFWERLAQASLNERQVKVELVAVVSVGNSRVLRAAIKQVSASA